MGGSQHSGVGQEKAGNVGERGARSSTHIQLPLTSLVGREQEIAQISDQLLSGQVRLLTLTGPGGVGKTRLALQVAARIHTAFSDSAYFVSLAPVSNPDLVLSTIAQTLGVAEAPGRPLHDNLCAALRDKHLLLILDNFEQVVGAAPGIVDLLLCAPRVHALVTSRIVLHVYGEHEFPVMPLALPDARKPGSPAQLTQYEAVRLFIERARAAKPSFSVNNDNAPAVAEICHRLDGLPLAIELAAARIRHLPPQALLKRLDRTLHTLIAGHANLPRRHQTLRNAIAWSYDLLSDNGKVLFRQLAVFVGGCTLEAVEGVCSGTSDGTTTQDHARDPERREGEGSEHKTMPSSGSKGQNSLEGLSSLVDQSLLRLEEQDDGEARYGMLETIREFAQERLAESEESETIRKSHAAYFVALAERAEPELMGSNQATWLDKLEREHDNMRAVLERATLDVDAETGLRLGGALWRFWYIRGYLAEGRRWLDGALQHAGNLPIAMRVKALNSLGNLAELQGDYSSARTYHEQNLTLCQEAGDKMGIARAFSNLGNVARLQGDYEQSRVLLEQSLALCRELNLKWAISTVLQNLGTVLAVQGDLDNSQRLLQESLVLVKETGDKRGTASALSGLGEIATTHGDYEKAQAYFDEALALWREIGDKTGTARVLYDLGDMFAQQGDYRRAHALLSDSLRIRYEVGNKRGIWKCLVGLATVAREHSEPDRLVRLLAAADALSVSINSPRHPEEEAHYNQWLDFARDRLGPEGFSVAWNEGTRLSLEEAIALALEDFPPVSPPTPRASLQGAIGAPPAAPPVSHATPPRLKGTPGEDLTPREVEVLRLVAVGLTSPDIAAHLQLSLNTIQSHMRSIFSKINVNTRSAAVRYAFEHNLG
jgi:predicted ATPase/DNA-binding CsgD family transcriptional regulator